MRFLPRLRLERSGKVVNCDFTVLDFLPSYRVPDVFRTHAPQFLGGMIKQELSKVGGVRIRRYKGLFMRIWLIIPVSMSGVSTPEKDTKIQ